MLTEISKLNKASRRRFFKRKARQMLFSNWLLQIAAFGIVFACNVGINEFGLDLARLVMIVTENSYIAEFFLTTFGVVSVALFIPLMYGLLCFEINSVNGNGNLADLFYAFSDVNILGRSYALFVNLFSKTIIYYIPALVLLYFLEIHYYNGIFGEKILVENVDVIRVVISAFVILLFYIGFVKTVKYFVGVYICIVRSNSGISDCFFVAKNCEFPYGNDIFSVIISFAPLFVVSLFTVGFLFIMYTLPYFLITLTIMAKYMFDTEMLNKETSRLMYDINEFNDENNQSLE